MAASGWSESSRRGAGVQGADPRRGGADPARGRVGTVDVESLFLTCECVLPIMEARGRGAVVDISSPASIRRIGYDAAACFASEGAVNPFTKGVATAYAAKGIRANGILPGFVDTTHIDQHLSGFRGARDEMAAARRGASPTGRTGDRRDVANAAVLLASDEAKYVDGVALAVDGGPHLRIA